MFLRNMRNLVFVMAPLILFVFVYSNFIQRKADPLAYVATGDAKIAAARDEARATLPTFLAHLKNPAPDESHFGVKFRLDRRQILGAARSGVVSQEPAEYIWARNLNLTPNGSIVTGFIDGEPRSKGFYSGQPLMIPLDDIVDWGYSKDGVMQGNFTTKVLLSKLPPAEAARAKVAMGWR
jgi:uncharacterized protein YegJ (DUF2314 family)